MGGTSSAQRQEKQKEKKTEPRRDGAGLGREDRRGEGREQRAERREKKAERRNKRERERERTAVSMR